MPNYRRFYLSGHPVFLTIVTHERKPLLADPTSVERLFEAMRWAKTKHPFAHLAHVILPDHMHWILRPEPTVKFSDIVASAKRDVAWRLKEQGAEGTIWQKRFYDHIIRSQDDLARHLDYVHFNPVKHGYVARPADYLYSSFAEWVKRGAYPTDWGATEPRRIKAMELE